MKQSAEYSRKRRVLKNEELRRKRLLASDPSLVISDKGKVYRWVWWTA